MQSIDQQPFHYLPLHLKNGLDQMRSVIWLTKVHYYVFTLGEHICDWKKAEVWECLSRVV